MKKMGAWFILCDAGSWELEVGLQALALRIGDIMKLFVKAKRVWRIRLHKKRNQLFPRLWQPCECQAIGCLSIRRKTKLSLGSGPVLMDQP